jgi:hypothetical protein
MSFIVLDCSLGDPDYQADGSVRPALSWEELGRLMGLDDDTPQDEGNP